jgi:hypothetical protein
VVTTVVSTPRVVIGLGTGVATAVSIVVVAIDYIEVVEGTLTSCGTFEQAGKLDFRLSSGGFITSGYIHQPIVGGLSHDCIVGTDPKKTLPNNRG